MAINTRDLQRICRQQIDFLLQRPDQGVWFNDIRCISYVVRVFKKYNVEFPETLSVTFFLESFFYNRYQDIVLWATPEPALAEISAKIQVEQPPEAEAQKVLELYSDERYDSYRYSTYVLPALKFLGQEELTKVCFRTLRIQLMKIAQQGFFLKKSAPPWQAADTINSLVEAGCEVSPEMIAARDWVIAQSSSTDEGRVLLSKGAKPKPDIDGTAILLVACCRTGLGNDTKHVKELQAWLIRQMPLLKEIGPMGMRARSMSRILWALSVSKPEDVLRHAKELVDMLSSECLQWTEGLKAGKMRGIEYCETLFLLSESISGPLFNKV